MQPPQQPEFPGVLVPPGMPQVVFHLNIGTAPMYYPAATPMLSQAQSPTHPQPATAVSKNLEDNKTRTATTDVKETRKAVPTDLSDEDEKTIIAALRKRNESGITLQQVIEELSQKDGRAPIGWEKWLIANFEKLASEGVLSRNPKHSSTHTTRSAGSRGHGWAASRTRARPAPGNRSLRSSTVTLTNEQTHPRDPESESETETETEESDDDQGSTYSDPALGPRHTHTPMSRSLFTPKKLVAVTDEDLRAMALYCFKKGGGCKAGNFSRTVLHEFADRPENKSRRSMEAWRSVARRPAYAAIIDQYIEEYQRAAESIPRSASRSQASSSPAGARSRKRAADSEKACRTQNKRLTKRKKGSRNVAPDDVIDLTVEMEA